MRQIQLHSRRRPLGAEAAPRLHAGRQVFRRSQLLRHREGAGAEAAPWSGSNVMAHLTIRLVTKQGRRLLQYPHSLRLLFPLGGEEHDSAARTRPHARRGEEEKCVLESPPQRLELEEWHSI